MKYLTLIDTIALLHQYQRASKKVKHDGAEVEYIEVTAGDIAIANRLAHQVLGRTLDELPPQTRRLLGLLDELVSSTCAKHELERETFLFSRRQVREHTGWSYEQIRVHLNRLVDLEYLIVHRGARGQTFVYELCYEGSGGDGAPRFPGLIDVETLGDDAGTTESLLGLNGALGGEKGEFGVPYRAHTGPIPGDAGPLLNGTGDAQQADAIGIRNSASKTAHVDAKKTGASYVDSVVGVSAPAATGG